jgi:RimJ/RimL family protein N-acetyltransferase
MVTVRRVSLADAEALLGLYQVLDLETSYMMLEPGERSSCLETVRLHVLQAETCPDGTLLVAEKDGHLVGLVEACGGQYRRSRHSVHLAMGVRKDCWGLGVGRRLLDGVESWARAAGKHRLELTVMTGNERAIRLYTRAGFRVEGTRLHSLKVDGAWVDELAMAKLLES